MESKFQILLILLAVLAGTALLARRVNIAPAILLLLAGIAIASDDARSPGNGVTGFRRNVR